MKIKYDPLTKAISNAGERDEIEKMSKNKRHSDLKMKCKKSHTAHSQGRCASFIRRK